MHVAAVGPDRDERPVRTFRTFTDDLDRLADWFTRCGIKTIAMESTGVYWIPVFEILEQRGFEVMVVNARDAKHVPGRKTDVSDAQWLQRLHEYGLLRASFRPQAEIAGLRAYLRQRERLLDYAAAHIQHMQKALMQMNLQLHHVVSDITGVTGMAIIRAIVAGERDPDRPGLASRSAVSRDRRDRVSGAGRQLSGGTHLRPDPGAGTLRRLPGEGDSLRQADRGYPEAAEADRRTAREQASSRQATSAPAERAGVRRPQRTPCDPRRGSDPNRRPRVRHLALKLVGECGTNLAAWPTAKHFTSWLALAPHNKISGGRVLSSRTRRTGNRAASLLRLAAGTVGRTDTALGAFYRRLSARIGKAKAITATARKIAVLFYNTLRHGMAYTDPGATYYEDRYRQRVLHNLQRRAKSLGFGLQPLEPDAAQIGVS